jgi:DNA-binding beta-propeller fold protein YncE
MVYIVARARRLRAAVAFAALLAAALSLGLATSPAWAGKGVVSVFGSSGPGDGQFANAFGAAVNLGSGDVYVVDQLNHRVQRFDASGAFVRAFGWGVADGNAAAEMCASNCQPGIQGSGDGQFDTPQGIAIDQSDGSVYVVDGGNNRVEKFDASGVYQSQFGSAGAAEAQFSGPQGIAVDPSDGSVYVADTRNNRVEKFDHTGSFVRTFGFGVSDGGNSFETCTSSCQAGLPVPDDGGFSSPTRVAVDSTGQVYVLDSDNSRIERYTGTNTFDQVFDTTDIFLPQEIAIGPGSDHLYVAQWAQDFSEQRVVEVDSAGTLIDTHAVGSTASNSSGLALGSASQKIYLSDGFNARVFILDDIVPSAVSIDPPGNVTATGASLSGSVTPNGSPNVSWRFETSINDVTWSPVASDQDAGSGNSPLPVAQSVSGLRPNTTYFVRLAASRPFNAPALSSEVQMTTLAVVPDVTTQQAQDIGPDHATLQGLIHPHHSATTYYFEYGPTTAYGTSLPATQDADAGARNALESVLQPIRGLQSGTTYHYRLVAHNQAGTVDGLDQTFTTTTAPPPSTTRAGIPGTGFLPDDRGWEKVSPADKNGGDIMADSQRVRVATDGDAVNFASLAAFGDARGTGLATDYASVRGLGDWSTHAITPPQTAHTIPFIISTLQALYTGPFSDDLSHGVFLGVSPVTSDPNVSNVTNIYVRNDLKTPGPGHYDLVSACPLCASTSSPLPPIAAPIQGGVAPYFAGASTDYGHVIFESQQPLTSDAPAGCSDFFDVGQCPGNLYEWDHGTVRLVGILPDGAAAPGSQAGQGAGAFQNQEELTPHTISTDGSRIFFTVPDQPGSSNGALYMRLNHTTTVQLNTSERASPAGGTQPATYWDASADGSRVFFTTTDALTDNAPDDGNVKLYMYDTTKPDSDPSNLTLVSLAEVPGTAVSVMTVLGVSRDGHYVYFASTGQLVSGEPGLGTNRGLFAWHDGSIRYIAPMDSFGDRREDTNTTNWVLSRPTARVTPDGLHLLFSYTGSVGPTGYDQGHCGDTSLGNGCRELYVYSFDSQQLACASCNPSGAPASASAFTALQEHTSGSVTSWAQNHPLSDDGQHVFFATGEALVPQDVNGKMDVYEYDVPSGTDHLITSGTEHTDSYFMNASASGNDVLFLTRQQLAGSDEDNNYDMYDARVNGGFPEPAPPPPACTGDACRAPQGQPPDAATPGSSLVSGSTTPPVRAKPTKKPATRCKKGYVRKKVRGRTKCVKKPKPHSIRKAKRARSKRGAK